MTVFYQDSTLLERRDVQLPENFGERGTRTTETVISQQFALDASGTEHIDRNPELKEQQALLETIPGLVNALHSCF